MSKTIEALIDGLTDLADDTVCAALADALEEEGEPRLADIKHLARVEPVIPIRKGVPSWEGRRHDRGAVSRGRPMACGTWWLISWIRTGVIGEAYSGTVQAKRIGGLIGEYLLVGEPNLPRRAFEVVRRQLLAAALGVRLDYDEVRELVVRPEAVTDSTEDDPFNDIPF
jgi:hypothetical protein